MIRNEYPGLDELATPLSTLATKFSGKRLFVSGASGFVGRWLVAALALLRRETHVDFELYLLTRDSKRARGYWDPLQIPYVLVEGDLATVTLPTAPFDYVIHGAAEVHRDTPELVEDFPAALERLLGLVAQAPAPTFLYLSSGAALAGAENSTSFYAQGKRRTEALGLRWSEETSCIFLAARLFAFVGPHLPLDGRFAIGNFIADNLAGRHAQLRGDGKAVRSYLYAADLALWLLTMLASARASGIFDVGSERAISIGDLATLIDTGSVSSEPQRGRGYLPDTKATREAFGLREHFTLERSIELTRSFYILRKS